MKISRRPVPEQQGRRPSTRPSVPTPPNKRRRRCCCRYWKSAERVARTHAQQALPEWPQPIHPGSVNQTRPGAYKSRFLTRSPPEKRTWPCKRGGRHAHKNSACPSQQGGCYAPGLAYSYRPISMCGCGAAIVGMQPAPLTRRPGCAGA